MQDPNTSNLAVYIMVSYRIPAYTTTEEMPSAQNPPVKESQSGDKLSGFAEKNSVIIGTNVDYASYVHNGTSRRDGRPFITEGINKTKDKMQEQVERILKGEL